MSKYRYFHCLVSDKNIGDIEWSPKNAKVKAVSFIVESSELPTLREKQDVLGTLAKSIFNPLIEEDLFNK